MIVWTRVATWAKWIESQQRTLGESHQVLFLLRLAQTSYQIRNHGGAPYPTRPARKDPSGSVMVELGSPLILEPRDRLSIKSHSAGSWPPAVISNRWGGSACWGSWHPPLNGSPCLQRVSEHVSQPRWLNEATQYSSSVYHPCREISVVAQEMPQQLSPDA